LSCVLIPEPLRKPTISLDPDSRVFVSGESAEISCSGGHPGGNFSLYRDGEFVASQTAPGNSDAVTFTAPEIRAGRYWCRYTRQIDGGELTSAESERVGVSVWANSTRKQTAGLPVGIVTALVITALILGIGAYKRDAMVRIARRWVPTAGADKTFADLTSRNRNENCCEAVEEDGPVYANISLIRP
uniref:Uncharacterized LOC103172572 n=1 Tax=Callorhinchus milii TaxID=7868 RepID=A0A4W3HKT2_CALMI